MTNGYDLLGRGDPLALAGDDGTEWHSILRVVWEGRGLAFGVLIHHLQQERDALRMVYGTHGSGDIEGYYMQRVLH